jgi:glycerol-3-phosphate acyltransferase PlsY
MDIYSTALMSMAGFILGAVPFSVIIGRLFLRKDIRNYGDGNPGSVNVFRAGGQKAGFVAVVLDIVKGVPFVFLAHAWLKLPGLAVAIVAISAVLGHAFSPFLRGHGGKAVAISFGVLLGLPQHDILLAYMAFFVAGFLFVENDSWISVLGAAATLAYVAITGEPYEIIVLLSFILVLFVFKYFDTLHSLPRLHGRLIRWLEAKLRGSTPA